MFNLWNVALVNFELERVLVRLRIKMLLYAWAFMHEPLLDLSQRDNNWSSRVINIYNDFFYEYLENEECALTFSKN